MEHGDLGTWVDNGIIVILEGYLAQIPPPETKRARLRKDRATLWPKPEFWVWSRHAIKVVNDKAYRLSMPIEVVTFLAQDVADSAAEWLDQYHVAVSGCTYFNLEMFCESLTWRPNVHSVIDSDSERLSHYGQRGYQAAWGGDF